MSIVVNFWIHKYLHILFLVLVILSQFWMISYFFLDESTFWKPILISNICLCGWNFCLFVCYSICLQMHFHNSISYCSFSVLTLIDGFDSQKQCLQENLGKKKTIAKCVKLRFFCMCTLVCNNSFFILFFFQYFAFQSVIWRDKHKEYSCGVQ